MDDGVIKDGRSSNDLWDQTSRTFDSSDKGWTTFIIHAHLTIWRTQMQRKDYVKLRILISQPFCNKLFNTSLLWISPFGLKSVTETVHESTILDHFWTGQEHVLVIFLFSAHPPSESLTGSIIMVRWVLWGMFDRDLPGRQIGMLFHGGERSFLSMAKYGDNRSSGSTPVCGPPGESFSP